MWNVNDDDDEQTDAKSWQLHTWSFVSGDL